MKTARQHLSDSLSKELYDKAMSNITDASNLDKEYHASSSALVASFVWSLSKEGFPFWEKIFNELELVDNVDIFSNK
jgi:hypothetical protein